MKYIHSFILLLSLVLCSLACASENDPTPETVSPSPVTITKTNPTKLYMHYMPWFHSKEVSGYWGIHWTMANRDPNVILPNDNRQIAAHYYPLIGPYDSKDPDLIDYHLLLMKYAGIDGLLIDWYGRHDVLDYGTNLENANALIAGIKKLGLEYGLVYEEFTAEEVANRTSLTDIEAARQDMAYAQSNYFEDEAYIKVNAQPLLLTFGPRYFTSEAQWEQILGALNSPAAFLPLWWHTDRVGSTLANGEFSWVDFSSDLSELDDFYQNNQGSLKIGSAYPGFHDFYQEGGWGQSYGYIDLTDGQTLERTLSKAAEAGVSHLQLVTWNDFGEGTMLEPTQEFGFLFLEQLQDFAGVSYDRHVFELIHDYYLKRKTYRADAAAQSILDDVFDALNQLEVDRAEVLLAEL